MNVVEIDGASNNGVDAIRELRDTVGYLPSTGKFKMYIIDEVHMLSTSAFNALLKTLEEPPGHVYFVMATTEVHKIPNTILSRTQRFDFRRIPTRVIAQHLQTICERDGIKFEADALWTIARQGDGSMRDSQSLLDQTINFTNGNLQRDLVVSTLGLTDRGLLNSLLAALMKREISTALDGVKALHNAGGDPKLFLLDVMEQIRNALLLKLNADKSMIDLPDSEQEALLKMSAELTPEDLHLLFDMALKGAQDLARASDALLILEMVLMRMATAPRVNFAMGAARPNTPAPQARVVQPPRPTANNTGNGSRPGTAERDAADSNPVSGANSPAIEAAPSPVPMEPTGPTEQRFKQLVEKIKDVNGLVGAQLENCFVVKLESKELTIGVSQKHKFLYDNLNKPDFKKKVVNYINSFWGAGYTLNIVLSEPAGGEQSMTPKALGEKLEADRRDELRKAIEAHPLVKSAQSVFKTEIKSIKAFPPGKP